MADHPPTEATTSWATSTAVARVRSGPRPDSVDRWTTTWPSASSTSAAVLVPPMSMPSLIAAPAR